MPTAYDAMLTQRARVWGLLCRARHSDSSVEIDDLYGRGDRNDVDELLERLEATSFLVVDDQCVRLTDRGRKAADRTFRDGAVPGVVMKGPNDWRTRAWQAMRIHRRFEVADIAATCDAPSYNTVRRYCNELVALGFLRQHGKANNGRLRYRLVRDDGPDAPRKASSEYPSELNDARSWKRRGWTAIKRLCANGSSVSPHEVMAAAELTRGRVQKLFVELVEEGALVRTETQGLYAMPPDAQRGARRILYPPKPTWQSFLWTELEDGRTFTVAQVMERFDVSISLAKKHLNELVANGLVVKELGTRPSDGKQASGTIPRVYRLKTAELEVCNA